MRPGPSSRVGRNGSAVLAESDGVLAGLRSSAVFGQRYLIDEIIRSGRGIALCPILVGRYVLPSRAEKRYT